ncbi:hypothetical protein JCGZ_00814 [Jatropha curcas]|uniref:Bifunctional inhibitor/plant lipid transfer protein/seed storage helical domain-containing protein n=1 Tax=Jatropha curcas TaxID=180498 RepID=A0A067KSD8_JATCU|nr:hypothetical protein JCGZ_00814 [Jatropha curcas]
MAKLITSTPLICILLVIIASAVPGYTTTTTTATDGKDHSFYVREICKEEANRKDLSSCENYIIGQSRRISEDMSAKRGIKNRHHVPRRCCNQASKLWAICRCESIMYLLEKQGHIGSQDFDEGKRRIKNIIDVCFSSVCPY